MEEEEKEAQSAKLQELIRRGTPADLQEANRLMKVMAGFDNRHKTDYRAKAAEEVSKVQQKAKILEEMLQSQQPSAGIEGDVFEELAAALQSAHPKIQKMCEEESDDPEAVHKLLEINDSIHRTIERYKLVKKGDLDAASRIPKGTLGTTTGVSTNANNELSLIDFDPEEPSSHGNGEASAQGGNALEDDLLGLSLGNQEPASGGGISLGGSSSKSPLNEPTPHVVANPILVGFPPISSGPSPPAASPQPAQQAAAGFKPNYDILASFNTSRPASQSSTPVPGASPQTRTTATPPQLADPFASLMSASPRPGGSPFPAPPPGPSAAASSSLLDLMGDTAPPQQAAGKAPAAQDDDWNFASSLPQSNALPMMNKLQVLNSQLRVDFAARRVQTAPRQIYIQATFSNTTSQPISDLHFQVAVEKVM